MIMEAVDFHNYVPFFLIPFIGWGVRRHLMARNDFSTRKKVTLGIGISAWFLTEMGRSFYRPYIYANDINDWGIADTIGNSFGTVTAVFILLTMSGRGTRWDWRIVGLVFGGLVGYEMLNLTGSHPFDVNDVLATLVFGAISVLVYARILARYGNKENEADPEATKTPVRPTIED